MKKILFLHGFASSGHSGTVMTLRQLLYADGVSVIAPDLPVMPLEAMALITKIVEDEQPDVVVTSSMGGLFGEQLRGIPRVLINPAWSMSRLLTFGGMGRREFYNKRADGAKDFKVDKAMVADFKTIEKATGKGITAQDKAMVWGLFGDKNRKEISRHCTKLHFLALGGTRQFPFASTHSALRTEYIFRFADA